MQVQAVRSFVCIVASTTENTERNADGFAINKISPLKNVSDASRIWFYRRHPVITTTTSTTVIIIIVVVVVIIIIIIIFFSLSLTV